MPRKRGSGTDDGMQSDNILNAGPPPGAGQTGPLPIGVPPDYGAEVEVPGTPFHGSADHPHTTPTPPGVVYQPPRYFDGDEWLPAQLSPDKIAELQRALIAAGLIPKTTNVRLGVWDRVSMDAYRTILGYANASGLDASAALDRYASAGNSNPNEGFAPLQIRKSNPEELKKVFRAAVIDSLGQGWDESKLDAMVAAYHATEEASQTEAYFQQVSGTGGTVADPPSPDTFAEQQVRSQDPEGVKARDFLGYADEFMSMLGGLD